MAKPGPKPGFKRKNTNNAGQVAKKVGRPPKSASKDPQAAPKRRGRPPKSAAKSETNATPNTAAAPKRRGRPPKAKPTPQQSQQQQNQEPEQAQSSHVQPQEALVLEVVGTSIQPAFVIQEHGVNSPDLTKANESTEGKPEGILSRLPSKKDVATAKKLAVKKTQAMKKTASKKVHQPASWVRHPVYLVVKSMLLT